MEGLGVTLGKFVMKVELKVIGGSRAGQTIPISIPQFMIGRAEDCHLKPRSELISRYHCTILSEEAYVAIRDLGSKNGVYLNGERIVGERELKNGDQLIIGPLEFEVVLTVGLKGETKSKVSSISEVVARAVEQNSINVATAKQSQAASQPAPTPTPAQPAAESGPASTDEDDLADWLLGDDDQESSEAITMSMSLEDLDLPYTPKEEEEEEKPAEEKPKKGGSSSSAAAADLLKNYFKGGR